MCYCFLPVLFFLVYYRVISFIQFNLFYFKTWPYTAKMAQNQSFCLTFMNAKIIGIQNYPQHNLFSKLA